MDDRPLRLSVKNAVCEALHQMRYRDQRFHIGIFSSTEPEETDGRLQKRVSLMDRSTKRWLDNDYWRVYTGILGLSNYQTTAEVKADFREEHEALVEKYRNQLEGLTRQPR